MKTTKCKDRKPVLDKNQAATHCANCHRRMWLYSAPTLIGMTVAWLHIGEDYP